MYTCVSVFLEKLMKICINDYCDKHQVKKVHIFSVSTFSNVWSISNVSVKTELEVINNFLFSTESIFKAITFCHKYYTRPAPSRQILGHMYILFPQLIWSLLYGGTWTRRGFRFIRNSRFCSRARIACDPEERVAELLPPVALISSFSRCLWSTV